MHLRTIKKCKVWISILIVLCLFLNVNSVFAATKAGQEMRTQVLYLSDIIENDNNMNGGLSRAEFAKMVVKASPYKDSVSSVAVSGAFNDVDVANPYASYIKIATEKGYMTSYLGGLFKPNDYMTYKDLIRACLALLGYENSDFTGNQVNGRLQTFTSLKMDENIEKQNADIVTKKDCVNALYNTLKTDKKSGGSYGPSVFSKMKVNSDGELNASGLIKTKLEGPFILQRGGEALNLAVPFSLEGANIFKNGASSNVEDIMRDLNHDGYLVYYYNTTTKTLYVYGEGASMESSTLVKKGYINHIYYNANDTITPASVEINLSRYSLGNSEMKFAFSYTGTLHVGDEIIYIYTKAQTPESEEDEPDGNIVTEGTITFACLANLRY